MMPIDVGLSGSASSGADSGKTGAFNLSGGGAKQMQTLYVIAGVLALFGLVLWFKR